VTHLHGDPGHRIHRCHSAVRKSLLAFTATRTPRQPARLALADLDAPQITASRLMSRTGAAGAAAGITNVRAARPVELFGSGMRGHR